MPLSHTALGVCVALLWGFNFVVMKHAASELPPLALTAVRFILAAVPAVFLVPKPAVSWSILLGFSIAFGVVKFGLLFTAFKLGMPAGLASLVLQMQALFTIVMAYVWLAERPTSWQWASLAVALAGVGVIMWGVASDTAIVPVLLTVAAALAWSVANIVTKRAGHIDMLGFAVWTALLAGCMMLAVSMLVEGPMLVGQALANMSWRGVGAVAYLSYPISILSGAMWGFLMSRYSAAAVAPFALLVPVIGMLSGYFVYSETLSQSSLVGAALVVSGLTSNMVAAARCQRSLVK